MEAALGLEGVLGEGFGRLVGVVKERLVVSSALTQVSLFLAWRSCWSSSAFFRWDSIRSRWASVSLLEGLGDGTGEVPTARFSFSCCAEP